MDKKFIIWLAGFTIDIPEDMIDEPGRDNEIKKLVKQKLQELIDNNEFEFEMEKDD